MDKHLSQCLLEAEEPEFYQDLREHQEAKAKAKKEAMNEEIAESMFSRMYESEVEDYLWN